MILHSPYGLRVHGPLALAVSRRLRDRYGIDEKPTASDDGIVVRLPDTVSESGAEAPPGAELFVFDADEIDPIVTAEVGGSALFASRFRECAARALLLPRRHPGQVGRRCGISASAPPSCSTWPASTRTSRSCWRRSVSACRTSTTCRRWPG